MNLEKEIEWLEKQPTIERGWQKGDIRAITKILELLVKVKTQGIRRPKKEKVVFEKYKQFIGVYNQFIYERQGINALIDAIQGNALNKIIAYLIDQSHKKSQEGALEAWEYIFRHWHRLTPFIAQQVTLVRIYANLSEILDQLKNGNSKNNKDEIDIERLKQDLKWDNLGD